MSMTHRPNLFCALALIAPGLLATPACEAEAGREYQGEVLLSLNGIVTAGPAVDSDYVLALAFLGPSGLYLVDGVTSDEFPAEFRFDVTSPPPEEAFYSFNDGPEPVTASATLAVVPRNHPSLVPNIIPPFDPSGHEEEETFELDRHACVGDTSQCMDEHLECTRVPCVVVSQEGVLSYLETEHKSSEWVTRLRYSDSRSSSATTSAIAGMLRYATRTPTRPKLPGSCGTWEGSNP